MTSRRKLILATLVALSAPVAAEEIHKWVDADGHVHFGDEASAKKGSPTVKPSGGNFVKSEHPAASPPPATPAGTDPVPAAQTPAATPPAPVSPPSGPPRV